ncbi:vanadium-dependent haloperoxidase [Alkalihalobacterium alkalinitrilicum]|uniref:vanadium-dependent haloperoxidase n=1 Tax=Alkalihalobacterium alkalinitrilicum TaxID=427920 RepID=UPI000994C12D|nr:vanadium-dependent haloperoxidase [Alkalihalobacterium alkalinitrilicum]
MGKDKKKCVLGPLTGKERRKKAYHLRKDMGRYYRELDLIDHRCNGDEQSYSKKIANFTKTLPHNSLGEVDVNAYDSLIKALKSGKPEEFEAIPMGGVTKLANPQAAYVYDLIGADCHQTDLPPAPAFSSAREASEMAEVYWRALTRDVHFEEYDINAPTIEAASELSRFSDFRGPKMNGCVTTSTLFRGDTRGDLEGPFVSQFLLKDIPFGSTTIPQRYQTTLASADHMTDYEEWLNIQNGGTPVSPIKDPTPRYIRNGRDLGEYVHFDFSYQPSLSACLILNNLGRDALSPNNPYLKSATQGGFITFGGPHILDLVSKVSRVALEAAWFHKFLVHRRLRPEEFGGRVHNHLTGSANYPIHNELLNSQVISKVFNKYGTYLLPMSYPEGCPTHPAYPAGHACLAGAGVTVLKAFFNEAYEIPNPVTASEDGLSLVPYSDFPLTIGGELNKLASNIALGRDTAGVHWRSDGIEGIKLGEAVAIEVLRDFSKTYNEHFDGFTLTKFDGTKITID